MGEFDLIARYFTRPPRQAVLGVGDDCALLQPQPGMHWAVSSDMLVDGRHFLSTTPPARLGHKALAVNLSDLAACGAQPVAFTLALALPQIDEAWLQAFSQGLWAVADAHGCELVGGDTTQGPLNICITVFGAVPPGDALLRQHRRDAQSFLVHCEPSKRAAWQDDHRCAVGPAGGRQYGNQFRHRDIAHAPLVGLLLPSFDLDGVLGAGGWPRVEPQGRGESRGRNRRLGRALAIVLRLRCGGADDGGCGAAGRQRPDRPVLPVIHCVPFV